MYNTAEFAASTPISRELREYIMSEKRKNPDKAVRKFKRARPALQADMASSWHEFVKKRKSITFIILCSNGYQLFTASYPGFYFGCTKTIFSKVCLLLP